LNTVSFNLLLSSLTLIIFVSSQPGRSGSDQITPTSRTPPNVTPDNGKNTPATKLDHTKAYDQGSGRRHSLKQTSSACHPLKPALASRNAAISNKIASDNSSQATVPSQGPQGIPKSRLPIAAADGSSSVAKQLSAQKRVRDTESEGIGHDGQQPQKKPRAEGDPSVNFFRGGFVAGPAPEEQFVLLRSQKSALGVSTFGHISNPNLLLFMVLLPNDKDKKIDRERYYLKFIAREIEDCVRKCNMEQASNEGKRWCNSSLSSLDSCQMFKAILTVK
jgi:hypothetical protein